MELLFLPPHSNVPTMHLTASHFKTNIPMVVQMGASIFAAWRMSAVYDKFTGQKLCAALYLTRKNYPFKRRQEYVYSVWYIYSVS